MKIKGIIFDLDGTLLDTIDDLKDSMNEVLKRNQLPIHKRDDYFTFVGNGAKKLVERALPEKLRDEKSVEKFLSQWKTLYLEWWNKETHLYGGIDTLLNSLQKIGIKMAILSNKPHGDVQRIVAHFFKEFNFIAVAGQKEQLFPKPSIEGVKPILNELKLLPEECLFVGDSSVDMDTANNCSMKSIGVSWGFRSVSELKEHGAHYIVNSPSEILDILREN